jgi:tRNA (cmo5U34)-methyltransferase
MGRLNGFDTIAPFYDKLAAFAFAGAIKRSQLSLLNNLPKSGRIAILGGGTGWIAEHILRSTDAFVIYIEASSKMIALSRSRLDSWRGRVEFIHGTEESMGGAGRLDAVIANYYFDLFDDERITHVVHLIKRSLNDEGKLFVSDFVEQRLWHTLLLRLMYAFFRKVAHLQTSKLPRWYDAVCAAGFTSYRERLFFSGFIKSVLFAK